MSSDEAQATVAQVIGLAQVFTPAQAAEVLRGIGLDAMTACALRTRAYRKQIPFHLNGHRIIFTIEDLREIAEGQSIRPQPAEREADVAAHASTATPARAARRAPSRVPRQLPADAWRARRPRHD
jgi:hypothetical protein